MTRASKLCGIEFLDYLGWRGSLLREYLEKNWILFFLISFAPWEIFLQIKFTLGLRGEWGLLGKRRNFFVNFNLSRAEEEEEGRCL